MSEKRSLAETVAEFFHRSYEELAPQHGYETRKESAKPWSEVPEQNRNLMIAVAQEVIDEFGLTEEGRQWASTARRYCYIVEWSYQDDEFVGTCEEFPSLSFLDDNRSEALEGIRALVQGILSDMNTTGEEPPKPLCDR